MNEVEHKRLDDLKQDLRDLRQDVNSGFSEIDNKLTSMKVFADTNKNDMVNVCTRERKNIYKTLTSQQREMNLLDKKVDSKFYNLDKKLFALFFIGNGVGIMIGSSVTLLFQRFLESGFWG